MYYDTKYSPTKNLKPLNFAKGRTFTPKIFYASAQHPCLGTPHWMPISDTSTSAHEQCPYIRLPCSMSPTWCPWLSCHVVQPSRPITTIGHPHPSLQSSVYELGHPTISSSCESLHHISPTKGSTKTCSWSRPWEFHPSNSSMCPPIYPWVMSGT